MDVERLKRIEEIYHEAFDTSPVERDAFLKARCGQDADLRREVESLLSFENIFESLLDTPPESLAGEILSEDKEALNLTGRKVSHYQIKKLLGKGGMGEVYLAEDTRLNRRAALKFLSVSISDDQKRLRRFEREAFAASALNHPNILTIYEFGTEDETPFIVTEYVEGKTLREILNGGKLNIKEIINIAEQTAFALSAAHKAGIVHRDIKPENIMLREDGIVKVLDFGLAKLIKPDLPEETIGEPIDSETGARQINLAHTNSSGMFGTVAYMSPEQTRGIADIDGRTDVWSLGVVLYEMLTGKPPFEGEHASDVIAAILQSEPAPLSPLVERVPPELKRLIEKALRKNPLERYQNSNDLLSDLRSLKSDLEFQSKIKNDSRGRPKTKIPTTAKRQATDDSLVKNTYFLPGLTETVEPDSDFKREVTSSPSRRFSKVSPHWRSALSILLPLFALGIFFFGQALMPKASVYTVDTTADDASLTACTDAPNDCSLDGAVANANSDGQASTIIFDENVFGAHRTISFDFGFILAADGKLTINGPPSGVTLAINKSDVELETQNKNTVVRRLFAIFDEKAELEISNLTLTGGNTYQGGAIYSVGKVTVINSIITGNHSTETGGGLTNRSGKMIVIDSTVSDNSSLSGGGVANIHGGMTLINTIISGNEAKLGGGIRNEGTLMLINTTVAENSASRGGGILNLFGTMYLRNTIVANSPSGGDCFRQNDAINAEYSLIEDGLNCVNGVNKNNLTGDPLLGSLTDNGGGSETYALLPGSIAIDAGSVALAVDADGKPLATDRRGAGFPRIGGGAVDIGAFEYQLPNNKD